MRTSSYISLFLIVVLLSPSACFAEDPIHVLVTSSDQLVTAVGDCSGVTAYNYTIANFGQPSPSVSLSSRMGLGGPVCSPSLSSISCTSLTNSVTISLSGPDAFLVSVSSQGKCASTCSFTLPASFQCSASCTYSDNPTSYWIEKHTFYYCGAFASPSSALSPTMKKIIKVLEQVTSPQEQISRH